MPPPPRSRSVRGWAIVAALVLSAGCVASGDDEAGAVQQALDAVAGPDPATLPGAIEGVVTTPSLAPIVGARVTLLRENVSTRTDASGAFRFGDLAPGQYLVAAEAEGHKPRTVTTRAANGTVTELDLTLEPDPRPEPRHETDEMNGLLACGLVTTTPARGEESVDCAAADPNHRDSFEFVVAPLARGVVVELVWSVDDNPGATRLNLAVETVGYGANDLALGNVTGEGYARIEVPVEVMDKYYPEGGALRALVKLVADGAPPAALAAQTQFTVFATTFYVDPAPPGFAVASGAS